MAQINWFEIMATDINRAITFYNTILETTLKPENFMGVPHGIFLTAEGQGIGAVISPEDATPSETGAILYLDVTGRMDAALASVEGAGGTVLMPSTSIGPQGFIAMIRDTEGNRIGLHATNQ